MKGLKFILAALGLILIVLFSYQVVFANEQSCDCENDQDCDCDSDNNQSCDCDPEESRKLEGYNSSEHWFRVTIWCTKCGQHRSYIDRSPHSFTTTVDVSDSSSSSCRGTRTKSCRECSYSSTSSFSKNHTRGSTCSICQTYYPSHGEVAQQKINNTNAIVLEGEDEQGKAEEEQDAALAGIEEGSGQYNQSAQYHDHALSYLTAAERENIRGEENNHRAGEEIEESNQARGDSATAQKASGELAEEAVEEAGISAELFEAVNAGKVVALEKAAAAEELVEHNEQAAEQKMAAVKEENAETNSGTVGDPVRYTSGELVSTSMDLAINSLNPQLKIIRNYNHKNQSSFSFGQGWHFNYDTRIIMGVRPDYRAVHLALQEAVKEVNEIYQQALLDYQAALAAAEQSIELAGNSVIQSNNAVEFAIKAKTSAEKALSSAQTAKSAAGEADLFITDVHRTINQALNYAGAAIESGRRAEQQAKTAQGKAQSALAKANQAIGQGESAVYHAERSGSSNLLQKARVALQSARGLQSRAERVVAKMSGGEGTDGKIAEAQAIQRSVQNLLTTISDSRIEEKSGSAQDRAENNRSVAENIADTAHNLIEMASIVYQSTKQSQTEAEGRLNELEEWHETLLASYSVITAIENYQAAIRTLAEQAGFDFNYSENMRARNRYNLDQVVQSDRDEIGIDRLIWIDEQGIPHLYLILAEVDFDSEVSLTNGSINYYPRGSQTAPITRNDARLEILIDGSYLLTKRDQTTYHYNYYGQLLRIEERNGRSLTFSYNEQQEMSSIVDSFGRELTIERLNGRIVKVTDPIGRECNYYYSGNRLTSYIDPAGNALRYSYCQYGISELIFPDGFSWQYYYTQLEGEMVIDYQKDPAGNIIDFSYDPLRRQSIVNDRRGNQTTYYYNQNHLTEEEINAAYHRVLKRYDSKNNLIAVTNQRGYTTNYSYDPDNNITSVTDPVGTTYFTYNNFNKLSSVTDKNGYTSSYHYDQRGNLLSVNYPDGSSKIFRYNQLGLLEVEVDQRGKRIEYHYDQYGNLKIKLYPDGSKEEFVHDQVGRLIKKKDAAGGEIIFVYDHNDNISKVVDQLGGEERFTYNSRNKIIEKVDPNGNITKYQYDERNNLSRIIDPEGNVKEIYYDQAENITRKVLAENISYLYQYDQLDHLVSTVQVETGIKDKYQYDPAGNLSSWIDGEGRISRFEYDALNRKVVEKDPLNNSIRYQYHPDNRLAVIKDQNGNSTSFEYDKIGRLVKVTDSLRNSIQYQYDPAGNMIARVDANGNKTSFEYSNMNRLVKEIDPLGNETNYLYDQVGNLVKATDPEGNSTVFSYDLKGRLIEETNALGERVVYQYDPASNLIGMTNQAGVKITYSYDKLNRLVEVSDVLGNTTKIGYTPLGRMAWQEDALANRIEFVYDPAGRLVKEIDQEGNVQEYSYDQAGNLIVVKDQLGQLTNYHYDQLNRLVEVVDALNDRVKYDYDPKGNLIEVVNRNGNSYQYQYDQRDMLVKEFNYQGNEQEYRYDPNGNLLEKTDFNGNKINYSYDQINRLLKVLFADGSGKEFNYNSNGMLTGAINQYSEQRYHYDQLSRLSKVEIEGTIDSYQVEYAYNEVGQKTMVKLSDDKLKHHKSRITRYEYDQLMRLARVEFPDGGNTSYQYDQLNRVITQVNSNRTGTNYTYTPTGRVETISHWQGLNRYRNRISKSYGYIYNARGERILQVEGNGQLHAYQYDEVGQLTKVYYPFFVRKKVADLQERFYYGLIPDWRDLFRYQLKPGNSLDWSKKQNLQEQITDLQELFLSGPQLMAESGNYPVEQAEKRTEGLHISPDRGSLPFAESLDLSSEQRDKIEELYCQLREYGGKLDYWGNNFWAEEYSYDPAGNVIKKANGWGKIEYQYNINNQLVKAGNRSYQYDLNGNLVREELGRYYSEYQYNAENRLIKAINHKHPFLTGGSTPFIGEISYQYDALSRKASKVIDQFPKLKTELTEYIYDGTGVNMLAEYAVYFTGRDYPDRSKQRQGNRLTRAGKIKHYNEYYYGNGLIAMASKEHPLHYRYGRSLFYHQDALGSVIMVSGKNGHVVNRYRYDAYGNPYAGRFGQGNSNNPYGFTGQRYESELGVYSFAYRTYNPRNMRWMTTDPIRDGLNWYQYCLSDPINLWDPLGLCAIDPNRWRSVMRNQEPMMYGSDVEELQESLNSLGYNLKIDGYYGPGTASTVKKYQQDKGLGVDGKVGPNTRQEIMDDLGIEIDIVEIKVVRTTETTISTVGDLYLNLENIGHTLELPNKDNREFISRIPAGEYEAFIRREEESKWSYDVIQLKDVPGRTNIQIHIGNIPRHTEGCILPGKTKSTDRVGKSAIAFNEIMAEVNDGEGKEIKVIIEEDF
ncbi:MAG: DUF5675 family protein [Halanaerobiales bacterium]|nr:DUF5675 family protein [Halanaerobiales bacterium]